MENTEYSNKIFLDGKTKNLRINVKKKQQKWEQKQGNFMEK